MNRAQILVLAITLFLFVEAALHPIRNYKRMTGVTELDYGPVILFFVFVGGIAALLIYLLRSNSKDHPS